MSYKISIKLEKNYVSMERLGTSLKYIFKSLHEMAADTSSGLFNYMNHTRSRSRRFDNFMLQLPNMKSNFLQNTIFYKGVKLWNELPLNIRQLMLINFGIAFKYYYY
jgi:hypothetical protein